MLVRLDLDELALVVDGVSDPDVGGAHWVAQREVLCQLLDVEKVEGVLEVERGDPSNVGPFGCGACRGSLQADPCQSPWGSKMSFRRRSAS